MKKLSREIKRMTVRTDPQKLRLLLVILSLIMFVLGAGAPAGEGGWGG